MNGRNIKNYELGENLELAFMAYYKVLTDVRKITKSHEISHSTWNPEQNSYPLFINSVLRQKYHEYSPINTFRRN